MTNYEQELNHWKRISLNGWKGYSPSIWRDKHIHHKQSLLKDINRSIEDLKGKIVVEIGCGPAGMLPYIEAEKKIGIDPLFDKYKEIFNMNDKDVKYICSEIEEFNENVNADIIICWNVLDHVKDIDKAMKKVISLMNQDGELWVAINLEDVNNNNKERIINKDNVHTYQFNRESVEHIFLNFIWREKQYITRYGIETLYGVLVKK